MPNVRSSAKQFVAVWLDPEYLAALDEARTKLHMDRSTFLRLALSEQLDRQQVAHDKAKIYRSDTTGRPRRRPDAGKRRAT